MDQLTNHLGTGSNPNLTMKLADSGDKWGKYDINYRGAGNIPWSSTPEKMWSAWDIFDEKKNYYGTINLGSDGTTAWLKEYHVKPQSQYCLGGFHLAPFEGLSNTFVLTVDGVYPSFPDAPLATPALYPGTNQPIVLSTKGAQIMNDQGTVVLLKGVARPSLEWQVNGHYGQYLSPSDIAIMRRCGANVLRISLNQTFWLASASREIIGSYKQIVDAMIYYAIEQKMAVILDLHILKPNPPGQPAVQVPMANEQSIGFWQDIARTYANFGTVLFELYNEPFGITQQQWMSGGGGYVGYQQLYDAVRAAGAKNNLCIVGGLDWAYDLSFVSSDFRVQGTGIVYCSHPYNPKGKDLFASNFAGVLGKFPVIFTEFGGNAELTYKDLAYYTHVISYVNTNGFHYTAWAWWVDKEAPWFPSLIGFWGWGGEMWINGGKIVREDLQKHPGRGIG